MHSACTHAYTLALLSRLRPPLAQTERTQDRITEVRIRADCTARTHGVNDWPRGWSSGQSMTKIPVYLYDTVVYILLLGVTGWTRPERRVKGATDPRPCLWWERLTSVSPVHRDQPNGWTGLRSGKRKAGPNR